jgi:hypothetical protein
MNEIWQFFARLNNAGVEVLRILSHYWTTPGILRRLQWLAMT